MKDTICNSCGSDKLEKRGLTESGKQRYRCNICGGWMSAEREEEVSGTIELEQDENEYSFLDMGATAVATAVLDKDTINTPEKLLKEMNIDSSVWEIEKKLVGKSTAWRKDRSVVWKVVDGKVEFGNVNDSGKIKTIPVFTVKVWLKRKTEEIRTNLAMQDFKLDAPKLTLKYTGKTPRFKKPQKGFMYEVEMPDLHIGKLAWGEETGNDTDLKIQVTQAKKVTEELLSYAEKFPIQKILFPIGHDFYNVDNQYNTTSHGTPQQEDTRWRKTFRVGWNLAADLINMCAQVAPVEVPIIGGNHDEERSFYLGEVLNGLYSNTKKRVVIDNSPRDRKYILFGTNLIGLTHGYYEKIRELKDIMSFEEPNLWAASTYREWHTGDKHHKEDFVHKTHEANNGVVIRILRSLSAADLWHYRKGYIGALRASESFLWHEKEGLKAQFTASP